MLEDALAYPTKGDSGIARIIIGGTLLFFSFLIIPAFFVAGYMLRTMAAASRNEAEPPAFEEWGGLFKDGLKSVAVGLAYGAVPFFVMILMFVVLGLGSGAGDAGGVFAGLGVLGLLVSAVLLFVVQYVLPAALTNAGRTGTVGGAFDFGTLGPVLTSKEYIVTVVLVFLVAVAGGIAFSVVAIVTLGLGYLAAPFFYFWLYLAGSYMFGTAFGAATRQRERSSGTAATPMD